MTEARMRPNARKHMVELSAALLQQLAAAEASCAVAFEACAAAEAARGEAEAARRDAEAARREAEAQLERIQTSTIWRMARPLRASVEVARRLRGFAGKCGSLVARNLRQSIAHSRPGLPVAPTAVVRHQIAEVGPASKDGVAPTALTNASPLASLKREFRERCARELDATLATGQRLTLPAPSKPRVSIVMAVHNQAELTLECLRSLAKNAGPDVEVIILDNASSDQTEDILRRIDGALVIRADENLHFLRGINRAAKHARGAYILLLNNDTTVLPGAIDAAAARLDAESDLGAVGGPILQLDGTLQEAGCIIWKNGHTEPYGQGADPNAPEFQFRRDVDYCSGAFLMVRHDLWESLGGFRDDFAPAYYEETDLCMRIRAAGFRVGYEPRANLVHFAYGSATSANEPVALYQRNHKTFLAHHADTLAAEHYEPAVGALAARTHGRHWCRALILDSDVMDVEEGWGSHLAQDAVHAIRASGAFVTYCRLGIQPGQTAGRTAIPADVETVAVPDAGHLAAFLRQRAGYYRFILHGDADLSDLLRESTGAGPDGETVMVNLAQGSRRRPIPVGLACTGQGEWRPASPARSTLEEAIA